MFGDVEEDTVGKGMPEPRLELQATGKLTVAFVPNVQVLFYLRHTSEMDVTRTVTCTEVDHNITTVLCIETHVPHYA